MLKTVTLCIGNSDDKLPQVRWAEYIMAIETMLHKLNADVKFSGFSSPHAKWQNACWVFMLYDHKLPDFKNRVNHIRGEFDQDSAAIVVGDTEFV